MKGSLLGQGVHRATDRQTNIIVRGMKGSLLGQGVHRATDRQTDIIVRGMKGSLLGQGVNRATDRQTDRHTDITVCPLGQGLQTDKQTL